MLGAFVNAASTDPGQRQSVRTLLESVFSAYETAAEKGGIANDLAGALAFYVGANYSACTGGTDISDVGSGLIVRQIQAALDTPQMRAAKDLEKQQIYENYIMLAGLLGARQQLAEGDAAATNELKSLGAEGLKYLLKVDPSRVKITDEGLRIIPIGGAASLPAKGSALVTLNFSAPPPWVRTNGSDGITLEMKKDEFYDKATTIVVLTGALPMAGSLQQTFRKHWREQILTILEGKENPFVMSTLLGPGIRSGFVQASMKSRQTGSNWSVSYYVVDAGTKVYPVMVLQAGFLKEQQAALDQLLRSLRIPGGAPPARPLASKAELARSWSTTSSSVTNYVNTYSGAHAGTSVSAYGIYYVMKPDGTYTNTFAGFTNSTRIKEKAKGTYKLVGDLLLFTDSNGRTTKNRFLGIDTPPGATGPIMLLLNPAYSLTSSNIGLYGERYGVTK